MKLLFKYMRDRFKIIIASVVFAIVFAASFALYQLPRQAVLYPVALCSALAAMIAVLDFNKVRRRHKELKNILNRFDDILDLLPEPKNIPDGDYQAIIAAVSEEYVEFRNAAAQRYSDMVDYYAAWAHQIKTPIASMRLNLQNEDSALSRKLSSDLFRIEQYVEMAMAFLRLDSEYTDYVIKEYDIDDIARQAVKRFAGEFINRRLGMNYYQLGFKVVTDEKWLTFVIEQILSNALKYTPSGGIAVFMQETKTLCIHDTGIGIAPEDLPRVFEKGYTGYNGREDKRASGIGLYLCKRICSNLGHRIWIESAIDEGTTVYIDLEQAAVENE